MRGVSLSSVRNSKSFDDRKELIRVATGEDPADLIILNGSLVNVLTGEILDRVVAIKNGRIAGVGAQPDKYKSDSTRIIDAGGLYLVPGLIDAHLHIESSLLSPTRFAELMASKGVTSIFFDPHEVANVSGLNGVRWMYDEMEKTPLNGFLTVPSCVPASSPELETTGAEFGVEEIDRALDWDKTAALGEMMNFPGVLNLDDEVLEKIGKAFERGLPVEGHASGLVAGALDGYGSVGIESDHEAVTKEEGIERGRKGFWTYIREGSGWADLEEVVKALTETDITSRRYCLVTDDRDVIDLLEEGGVDHVVRRAIEEGLDPVDAITMATLNPATRFGLGGDLGSISPGRVADVNFVSDLETLEIERTMISGVPIGEVDWPDCSDFQLSDTVNIEGEITPALFELDEAERKYGIGVRDQDVTTQKLELTELEGTSMNTCAVIERHNRTGNIGRCPVRGFDIESGAIASTVAHDSHNLITIGSNSNDMSIAVNYLRDAGGGQVVVGDGQAKDSVELPIAGLMSDLRPEEVASDLKSLKRAIDRLGCSLKQPLMILSSLALAVIPEVRITDKGLVDVNKQKIIH